MAYVIFEDQTTLTFHLRISNWNPDGSAKINLILSDKTIHLQAKCPLKAYSEALDWLELQYKKKITEQLPSPLIRE
jgi:hypothetical protein